MAQETTTSHDWREAGEAWGDRATDWAYLWEPYARSANQAVFDQLAVADGTRLLDIACGSGFAAHLASERGAAVSGIDASERLVTIARARTPQADFRVGDMFALPFPDASFDAATSFNGIWKGCEAALLRSAPGTGPGRPARPDLLGPVRAPRPHALLRQGDRALRSLPRRGQHGTRRHPERDRGHVAGHWVRTASSGGPSPSSTNGPTSKSPSARSPPPAPRSRRYGQSASTSSATPCAASSNPCTFPGSGSASPPNSIGSLLALDSPPTQTTRAVRARCTPVSDVWRHHKGGGYGTMCSNCGRIAAGVR